MACKDEFKQSKRSAKALRPETPEGSQRGSRLGEARIMVANQQRFWVG